jgi:hypothetical protein
MYSLSSGFVAKNKDSLSPDMVGMVRASENEFLVLLFAEQSLEDEEYENKRSGGGTAGRKASAAGGGRAGRVVKKKPQVTIAAKFKLQLHMLYEALLQTEAHYIRCIKVQYSLCTHYALTMHSLCTHYALTTYGALRYNTLTMHSLCTHCTHYGTHHALTMHSLCTHCTHYIRCIKVQYSLCTHYALTMHSLYSHYTLTIHSLHTVHQAQLAQEVPRLRLVPSAGTAAVLRYTVQCY